MLSQYARSLLKRMSRNRQRQARRSHGPASRSRVFEHLEDRRLLATISWINTDSGSWSNPANWSSGVLPGPADDVVIDVPASITITHSSGSDTIQSLTGNPLFFTGSEDATGNGRHQILDSN